jgi:hypothetical protein
MSEVQNVNHTEVANLPIQKIIEFLTALGLPSDNIIAEEKERQIITKNLPEYIMSLPDHVKADARYLSKYVVGAGFGLFDYSLNSVWNEVTIALRKKAITYGLEIFYDAAVGGKLRAAYTDEDDLPGLKDSTLLDTCKKLELISETTYKKLSHMLDMRNDIGISHPTNYTINGFELLGWLQTCVQDVLSDQPSPAAIQIKSFIDNLRDHAVVLDSTMIAGVLPQIQSLSSHHCSRILQTLFGIYVTDTTSQILRKNIAQIAPTIWDSSLDQVKVKLGIILEGFNSNLHTAKYQKGEEFFDVVSGNSYRTKSQKLVLLNQLVEDLKAAHSGLDNFYHEVPVIEKILTFIQKPDDIPNELSYGLIVVILKCRIGRGVNYRNGVSPQGKPLYDQFFNIMREDYLPQFLTALTNIEVRVKLWNSLAKSQLVDLLKLIRVNIINERYLEAIGYLIKNIPHDSDAALSSDFKKITSSFLKWI